MCAGEPKLYEFVHELIEVGADVNCQSESDLTALMYACMVDNVSGVCVLLDAKADVHCKADDGRTALHIACQEGYPRCVRALMNAGARLDVVEDVRQYTPLMFAVECAPYVIPFAMGRPHDECATALIEAHADVNAFSSHAGGMTALRIACEYSPIKIVWDLLDAGATIDRPVDDVGGIRLRRR